MPDESERQADARAEFAHQFGVFAVGAARSGDSAEAGDGEETVMSGPAKSEPEAPARGSLYGRARFEQTPARWRLGLGLTCFALTLAACDRAPTPQSAAARHATASPKQVVQRLIDAHKTTAYASIEPLCVPQRVSEITATLTAIDEFLTANEMLCSYVRDHISGGVARVIDQSQMAGKLDIVSQYVDGVGERCEGELAEGTGA